jgi:AraC family transcriptional regulator
LDWTSRLNAAVDYLEETWDREPDLERAAALANCSAFHFLRMFEVVSGLSPGEYSRRRRLSRAAIALAAGNEKVIDVALRFGYETPEAFAKAFKRLFGMTPTEARIPGVRLETWPPLRLAVVLKGERAMNYRIVEKPAFTAGGWTLRTVCANGQNHRDIPQFWDQCHANGKVKALMPFTGKLGFIGLCAEWSEDREEFTYLIGVEAVPGVRLPEGTRGIELPAATYVVFESVGAMPDAIQNVWKTAFAEWFPTSGFEHAGTPDFEVYPEFPDGDPRGDVNSPQYYSEVWVPIRPKKG